MPFSEWGENKNTKLQKAKQKYKKMKVFLFSSL